MLVDVTIATLRRPALLRQTLLSVIEQELGADLSMRIIVVDNDAGESAREVVETSLDGGRIPFLYVVEPVQGLSHARNRSFDLAQGEFLAIIDDDEVAERYWLLHLVDCARRYEADAVFGPALAIHPEGIPEWIAAGRFFDWPRHATGTKLRLGDTANVLIRRAILAQPGARFSPAFRTSGEDTDFFLRLGRAGARFVWCDEAVVHAPVAPERASLRYLMARSYRDGGNWARAIAHTRTARAGRCGPSYGRCWRRSAACSVLPCFRCIARPEPGASSRPCEA
jgi:succinoglycan biosynthesis protein ExoM